MEELEGAEEALDMMITKRKLKVEQAMLLRNQLERMWVDYDDEPDSDMGRGSGGFDSPQPSSSEVQKSGRY